MSRSVNAKHELVLPSTISASLSEAQCEAVMDALQLLCESAEFARSERVRQLLRSIVEYSLRNPETGLTERTIAREILQHGEDWDPKLDPSIRISVGRLRTKLERYYARSGGVAGIRIELPKGGYTPQFIFPSAQGPSPEPGPTGAQSQFLHKVRALRSWHIVLFASCVALALSAVGLFLHYRSTPLEQHAYVTLTLTGAVGRESSPSISPDGREIVYAWNNNGENFDIYMANADGSGVRRFTESAYAEFSPSWSPDGKQIAFLRVKDQMVTIVLKEARGGAEKVLCIFPVMGGKWTGYLSPVFDDIGPSWSPDGHHLVYSDLTRHSLIEIDVDSGTSRALTSQTNLTSYERDFYPRYSPDGKYIAYAHYTTNSSGDLYVLSTETLQVRRLTFDLAAVRGESWFRDSRNLVFASRRDNSSRLWVIDIRKPGSLRLLPSDSHDSSEPVVDPKGCWLAYIDSLENWNLQRYEITAQGLQPELLLLPTNGKNHDPVYSPDGKHFAFVSDRSGRWEVWEANADGSSPVQLTDFEGHWKGGICWAPDGRRIAFDARVNGHSNLFLVDVASHRLTHLIESNYEERVPYWSHDGRSIYFSSTRSGVATLYRYHLADGVIDPILSNTFSAQEATERGVYYALSTDGVLSIHSSIGETLSPLPREVMPYPFQNWTSTPTGLYYGVRPIDLQGQSILQYAGGKFTSIGHMNSPLVEGSTSITVSPDGHHMIVAVVTLATSNIKLRHAIDDGKHSKCSGYPS